MSLEFLAGSPGSGRSHTLYREIIDASLASPDKSFLVIVPEQSTMQTQKEMVRLHPRHGMLNIDVLSFNRLAWRVFEEVGGSALPILEETGKTLILQRVIRKEQKNLGVLGKTLSKQGSVLRMKSLISELLQYGVTPDDLDSYINDNSGMLSRKMEDVRLIYSAFREYLEERYLTLEEVPEVLCGVIDRSALIRGSVIALDGFTGFTPLQYKVIRSLLGLAEKVTVTVTAGEGEDLFGGADPHELFYMSREMVRRCTGLARETGTEILPVRRTGGGGKSRFSEGTPLWFIEKNVFRYGPEEYKGSPEGVVIYEAADPRREVSHVTSVISSLVREKGYRYGDIAIVAGDQDTYGDEAAGALSAAGIPYFLDRKEPVLANPLVECVRALLQMISSGYSYDGVFRFLRSGMTDISAEETDRLENYVLATGIRGRKRYAGEWVDLPDHIGAEDIAGINAIRERFCGMTEDIDAALHDRKGSVRTKTEALYSFLVALNAQEKTEAFRRRLEEEGDAVRAEQYAQIFRAVMDLLDKTVEVLGDEKMGVEAYAEVLDAGFTEMRVGAIPPGEDQVVIGDMTRTRLGSTKVLFLMGVNDGVIPSPPSPGGLLSEWDREDLNSSGIELAPTAREEIYRQRFYLYLAMTRPSDMLCLSYSRSGAGGKSLLPSYLISTVCRLFPDLEVIRDEEGPDVSEALETEAGRKSLVIRALSGRPGEGLAGAAGEVMLSMYRTPEGEKKIKKFLDAMETRGGSGGIGRDLAEKLYGRVLVNSATRLEMFAGCAFRHFCSYGLRLAEREIWAFTPADLGSIMHAALEDYSLMLREDGLSWRGLDDSVRNDYAEKALSGAAERSGSDMLFTTARGRYLNDRMLDMLKRTLWALQIQVEQGEFTPADFEFAFTDDISAASFRLGGDARMKLTGRIDRLDLCGSGNSRYVKIIDYKTGNTTFDLNRLFAGLQLQLVLYMNAALETERKKHPGEDVEPAGLFYYRIKDPYVESGKDPERELLRAFRPDGRCRSEDEVLGLFDRELAAGGVSSDVVNVEKKTDGSLKSGSAVADKEEFDLMLGYGSAKAAELADRILSGETDAAPYVYGRQEACTWCPYKSVCGFDEHLPGCSRCVIRGMEEDDIYFNMNDYLEEHGDGLD